MTKTALETKDAAEAKQDNASTLSDAIASLNAMTTKASALVSEIQSNHDAAKKETELKPADPLDEQKHKNGVADLASALDEIKSLRVEMEGLQSPDNDNESSLDSYKAACDKFMRKGEAMLTPEETKALTAGTDSEGGYTVYDEEDAEIIGVMRDDVPLRRIARVRNISSGAYKQPKKTGSGAKGWVGETAARPPTTAPTLGELNVPVMEMFAMPEATQALLDDSAVNIEQWLAEEVREDFAELENAGGVNGTGSGNNQMEGFLAYTGGYVANALHVAGKIGYIATGAGGAFGASGYDNLIDLWTGLKAGYKSNGKFVMNSNTLGEILKIKDADGNPIYKDPIADNPFGTIQMRPIELLEDMPDIAADSYSVAFGDFGRGYLIVDRIGVRVLRDPYSNKPYIQFYTTKRVGGGVRDEAAIKLLKFSAA